MKGPKRCFVVWAQMGRRLFMHYITNLFYMFTLCLHFVLNTKINFIPVLHVLDEAITEA